VSRRLGASPHPPTGCTGPSSLARCLDGSAAILPRKPAWIFSTQSAPCWAPSRKAVRSSNPMLPGTSWPAGRAATAEDQGRRTGILYGRWDGYGSAFSMPSQRAACPIVSSSAEISILFGPPTFTKLPRSRRPPDRHRADPSTDKVWEFAEQALANQWADPGRFGSLTL
jgi:hypothetical protein